MTIRPQQPSKLAPIQTVELPPYDSKPLATALATLSQAEIESMLVNIATLETQIAKLNIAGHEDAMMHIVTDGLRRLTYFLDAVKKHKTETGDDKHTIRTTSA
jgi:hypothetical protein